ncbi:glycoside hydrolase superfamily [Phaeosphaeriaceae sp. PMI808]|nr:glycoside hydrolase superfamily [Phaeosphaeriaceae sp. PMI808]
MSADIETVLQSLTLEEKISLLAGKSFWETVPISEKGVPAIKTSDGPNGARGEVFTGGTQAACFPAAVCSAATWNQEFSQRIGNALAEEIKTKGARVLLAPTMCNHRHPLGGRNFESFSEDPLLTGKMAANIVKGVQSQGIAATIKHFAANEQETERLTVNEIISERALREIYMKPFEITVKEANPWGQVLRGEWGWNGLVMSDWGGTNSTADSLNAGLDLEMPGPTRFRTLEAVKEAIKKGEVTEQTITERARNVLKLIKKVGGFENPEIPPENLLPLKKGDVKGKTIGLFGLAKEALIHGGGSASLNAHYRVTPEEGLKSAYGDKAEFKYAKGAHIYRLLPPLSHNCTDIQGSSGWTLEMFSKGIADKPSKIIHKVKDASFSPLVDPEAQNKEIRMTTTFVPSETGAHYLGCSGVGPTTVTVNGNLVFEQKESSSDSMAFLFGSNVEKEFQVPFTAGKSYKIQILSKPPSEGSTQSILAGLPGLRMGFMSASEHDFDMLTEARDLAKEVDISIIFTGHTPVWETEGQDQLSFNLPRDGSQDRLVEAVSSVNRKTIVVNSTGVAVALPWLTHVAALVQAWFPGQEAGNAIADIITGTVNPSGKLPMSWPKHIEDAPAYGNFPGEKKGKQLTVRYNEGVFVGYRHYDRIPRDKLQFPFGYGLSYTTFSLYGGHVFCTSASTFKATIAVKNTGKVSGATVVQLYVGRTHQAPEHPIKTLAAFKKVFLEPGQQQSVELELALTDFAYFNEAEKKWKVDRGRYDFSFGQSAQHVESVVTVDVEGMKHTQVRL